MKSAIITGATGLIGNALAKYLSSRGVELLCIGRKKFSNEQIPICFGINSIYTNLAMKDISLLPQKAEKLGWDLKKDSVFYNFAWSGHTSLSDGEYSNQLTNAINAANAVKVAKAMSCVKFINSGSMEETFIENHLNNDNIISPYISQQTNYGLAKIASRDMCKIVAYLEKIDYIHTRISVPICSSLSTGNYICSTIKKIMNKEDYIRPSSKSLYDIIMLDDVINAYHLIGIKGRNKANYFIGTGDPALLMEHFERITNIVKTGKDYIKKQSSAIQNHDFSIKHLRQDTGFNPSYSLNNVIVELLNA